jgi:hypothetical protein
MTILFLPEKVVESDSQVLQNSLGAVVNASQVGVNRSHRQPRDESGFLP